MHPRRTNLGVYLKDEADKDATAAEDCADRKEPCKDEIES